MHPVRTPSTLIPCSTRRRLRCSRARWRAQQVRYSAFCLRTLPPAGTPQTPGPRLPGVAKSLGDSPGNLCVLAVVGTGGADSDWRLRRSRRGGHAKEALGVQRVRGGEQGHHAGPHGAAAAQGRDERAAGPHPRLCAPAVPPPGPCHPVGVRGACKRRRDRSSRRAAPGLSRNHVADSAVRGSSLDVELGATPAP
jgi:hypothetical protein